MSSYAKRTRDKINKAKAEKLKDSGHKKWFECTDLLKKYPKARYYFILAGRSTGKTYSVLQQSLKDALDGKGLFAYVRRYKDSITDTYIQDLLKPQWEFVEKYTNGEWNRLGYWRKRWYLERWERDENGDLQRTQRNPDPIGGAFAVNTWETSKGPDFGALYGIKNIILDEALSKGGDYLTDEWGKFENVVSSLVRDRTDADTKIWLLANPVSKWNNCYFNQLGITKKMYTGEDYITLIEYPNEKGGKSTMSTVFCYIKKRDDGTGGIDRDAVYDTYFAFPNSKGKSKSITDGMWEMEDANILPSQTYQNSEKNRTIYFKFQEELFACDVMRHDVTGLYYLFFHPTEKLREKCYYFTLDLEMNKYAIVGCKTGHPIADLFNRIYRTGQVYYSDNMIADCFHGFIKEANKRII